MLEVHQEYAHIKKKYAQYRA